MAKAFKDLDAAVRNMVITFRAARDEIDAARQKGYFAVSREHADILMGDALNSGLQNIQFDKLKVPYVDPARRRTFADLGQSWAAAMRGRCDAVLNGPPPPPPKPVVQPMASQQQVAPETPKRRPNIHDVAERAGQEVRIGRR